MSIKVVLVLFALVGAVFCSDAPHLVVSKSVETKQPVANSEMDVTVRIFNIGSNPVYDVSMTDVNWPSANFTLASGSNSAKWDKIPAGANVTHTYQMTPLKVGRFYTDSAIVSYKTSQKGQATVAYSSNLGVVRVYRASEVDRRSAPHFREWGVFSLLGLGSIFLPLVLYVYISMNYSNGVPKALAQAQAAKTKRA